LLAFEWIDALGWPENRLSVVDINHIPKWHVIYCSYILNKDKIYVFL